MKETRKLKIAIICDSYELTTGGAYVSIHRFVDKLCDRGHKVIIITSANKSKAAIQTHPKSTVYEFPASFALGPQKVRFSMFTLSRLIETIKENDIDLLYFHMPTLSGYQTIRAAKKLGIPVVSHFHMQPENVESFFPFVPKLKNRVVYRYMAYFFNNCNLIISPSEFGKKMLKLNRLKTDIVVISNGVPLNQFKISSAAEKARVIRKYKFGSGPKLLAVSRLDREKKIETMIKAAPIIAKAYPDFELLVVGKGEHEKRLKRLIKKLDVEKNVRLLGKVDWEDLTPLYCLSDMFVHASIIELEGMVILEAMACGLPLLIADSETSAAPTLVEDNGLLFKPLDFQDLAAKAIRMLSDEEKLTAMRKQSLKIVGKYDLEKSIDKLEAAFYSILTKK